MYYQFSKEKMTFTVYNNGILSKTNQSIWFHAKEKDASYGQTSRSHHYKSFTYFQIIEICFLILILFEHTIVFIVTFQKKSLKTNRTRQNQRSIILPSKSFLYSCLHRNWIRAFSFSNMCLSCVYFIMLLLKHYHPNLVHHSSITFYSLPLNLLKQMLINFSTFHLFIISITVFQYFLRYYRLLRSTYSSYFFNGKDLLLTKHTNVALILSSSLALIFAYNFIFYTPKSPHTISFLPLITFNMILLPLINLIICSFIFVCLMINYFFKSNLETISIDNEQENLRLLIEKNTCIKCYSKILEKNPNLFQDKNYSYKNLYKIFFSTHLHSSYPYKIQQNYFFNKKNTCLQTDLSYEHENDLENNSKNNLFFKTTLIKLNRQHSLCHLSHYLLIIFLFKYILLTFPQHILIMLIHLKQFYQFILKHNLSTSLTYSLYNDNEFLLTICHYLFLLSRFGDSFLLIRLPYLIKKYFPCWCHFNSKLLRKQKKPVTEILTIKNSASSHSETISALDISNLNDSSNESKQNKSMIKTHWKTKHRRYRLHFQFVPLWTNDRPKLFKEHV
ncbi:unnamed protein product [Rotaria sp. Silwood1]|nr:unnamed protein product [Rotaria sp. Silwood1]CAF1095700.1 unnamed protein product [Rotaria sp. Silwood1]CAF3418232.1 unnamed protein product [Rotaria sp. Silwood1]CAF4537159.1 unnamed protein product [Rotaria sp. Silwood1]